MIHPDTELRFISDDIGYGVFATRLIPKGTITYVRDSLEIYISEEEFEKHPRSVQEVIEKYSFTDQDGYRIVSWDFAKYVNHCCNCNTISTGYGFEIAIRDIHPGEQITDEYGIFNMKHEMPLNCSQNGCRNKVTPNDFDNLYPAWDEKIQESLKSLLKVNQPLYTFVDEATRSELENYLHSREAYRSVNYLKLHHQAVRKS